MHFGCTACSSQLNSQSNDTQHHCVSPARGVTAASAPPSLVVDRPFHLFSVDTISPLTDASSSLALAQASSASASRAAACHTQRFTREYEQVHVCEHGPASRRTSRAACRACSNSCCAADVEACAASALSV